MAGTITSKRTAGFTLAELLVVVAIIGVLVAIAIPAFTASLESAKEATCQANRRSMYGEVVTTAMSTHESEKDVFERLKNVEGKMYTCPDEGEWEWIKSTRVIKCSIHGLTVDEEMYSNILDRLEGEWGGPGDTGAREKYASVYGITEWPPVTGTDGTEYYLQFKSWGNKSSTSFLYAGYTKQISGGGDQWNAKYVCDSQGLLGTAGQWYEFSGKTGLANARPEDKMKALLETGTKVNLINGKFEAA